MSIPAPILSDEQLSAAAAIHGTPVYVYHAERIAWQYERLKKAFSRCDTRIFYACKSLTNVNILKYIHQLGAGIDCVSINEVKLGLRAGFSPGQILFTPNCTDFQEYQEAAGLGVYINIDNLVVLERFGKQFGDAYPVCIRLNPHIMAGGNLKISTGHEASKFGISFQQVEQIMVIAAETKLRIQGIHVHTGSEIKDVEVFIKGMDMLLGMAKDFPDLKFIDLGGGFKVAYKPGDPQTDIELLGLRVAETITQFEVQSGKKLQVWFEPGKFLVSECGYLVVKANVIKSTPATVFVGVNSGFNHLIRPMFYDAYHRIENISNRQGKHGLYSVVGNICETDTFAWDRELQEVREGDLLVFYNAGAYGFEMSSQFNSRLRPAEVMYINGKPHLIRQRDEFDDLLRGQIEVL